MSTIKRLACADILDTRESVVVAYMDYVKDDEAKFSQATFERLSKDNVAKFSAIIKKYGMEVADVLQVFKTGSDGDVSIERAEVLGISAEYAEFAPYAEEFAKLVKESAKINKTKEYLVCYIHN